MPTPSSIGDLSQVAASNFPAGSDSPALLDDVQRAQASFIAMLRDGKGFSVPVTLASAATTDIGAQNALAVEITGTTTITSFGTSYNGPRFLRFTGALILTHNATTLNLPGAQNITTAAGDTCIAYPNSAANGWNVVQYQRASFLPVAPVVPSSFRADNNAVSITAIPNATYTRIQLSTERHDTNSEFASGRFTAKSAGVHRFRFQFGTVNPTAGTPIRAALYVNGGMFAEGRVVLQGGQLETVAVESEVNLIAGDFVDTYVYQGRGTGEDVTGIVTLTFFCGGYTGA